MLVTYLYTIYINRRSHPDNSISYFGGIKKCHVGDCGSIYFCIDIKVLILYKYHTRLSARNDETLTFIFICKINNYKNTSKIFKLNKLKHNPWELRFSINIFLNIHIKTIQAMPPFYFLLFWCYHLLYLKLKLTKYINPVWITFCPFLFVRFFYSSLHKPYYKEFPLYNFQPFFFELDKLKSSLCCSLFHILKHRTCAQVYYILYIITGKDLNPILYPHIFIWYCAAAIKTVPFSPSVAFCSLFCRIKFKYFVVDGE